MSETVNEYEFHKLPSQPFAIHGLYAAELGSPFKRLPDDVAQATSNGVFGLRKNTAGGRVRFETDSEYICVKLKGAPTYFDHMTLLTSHGCDLYRENEYGEQSFVGRFAIPLQSKGDYISNRLSLGGGKKYLVINMPLYGNVDELSVGLAPGATVGAPLPYRHTEPIVFYGSSITQGGCASRPGLCYENHISRELKTDYINLGFSGNARGEEAIVNYMASLDMCAFVSDYDHNAPSPGHLESTHFRMYETVRSAHPSIPYVMISRPDISLKDQDAVKRRAIVMESYLKALNSGDKNVYFIDGYSLFEGGDRDFCTVDGCHPTDVGFLRMGKVIGDVLRTALKY